MKIKNLFKSKIHARIMRFFHENPASIDTARGIATWINQDLGKVRTALNKLVKAGKVGKIRHVRGFFLQSWADESVPLAWRFDKKLAQEEVWIRKGIKARRTRNEGRVRELLELRRSRQARREQLGKVRMDISTAAVSGPSDLSFPMASSPGVIQGPQLLFITMASNCLIFSGAKIVRSSLITGSKAPLFLPRLSTAQVP